jgi:hypothetical protein
MAGIFPEGGVNRNATVNTVANPQIEEECTPLWFGLTCRPNFDPAQANALMSELLNAMKQSNVTYDCNELDNLADAMRIHSINYSKTIFLPDNPYAVLNGTHVVRQGNFTVPNTYNRTIRCLAVCHLTVLVKELDAGESIDVNLGLSADNSYDGSLLYTSIAINNLASPGDTKLSFQTTKTTFINIPPGGKQVFYRLETTASAGAAWELVEDQEGMKYRFYGVSAHTYDDVSE